MKRIYTVRQTIRYTANVEVEASSESEAIDIAQKTEGISNYDDYLYECEIIAEREEEE
jgi:hypothetical protein